MTTPFAPPTGDEKLGALLVRLALAAVVLAHGIAGGLNLPATLAYFASLGVPAETASLVAAVEIGGGLPLLAGSVTRWSALALLPVLLGVSWVHLGNGWQCSASGGWKTPVLLALLAVVEVIAGNRRFVLPGGLRLSWRRQESAAALAAARHRAHPDGAGGALCVQARGRPASVAAATSISCPLLTS